MKSNFSSITAIILILLTSCSGREKSILMQFDNNKNSYLLSIKDISKDLPSDWSDYGFLTFDLLSSTTQRFEVMLHDSGGIRRININPFQGAKVRVSIPLIHFQKRNTRGNDMAAIGKSARPGYWIGFTGAVGSIKHIDSLGFTMRQPSGRPALEISQMRLTMEPEDTIYQPHPLVDEFGQWIPAEWPGKITTIDGLNTAWNKEEAEPDQGNFKVSVYGGFAGTAIKGTGFFRVEKIDGKWWFIDPDGYQFFSVGSDCISPRSADFARIQGREYIFKSLPPESLENFHNIRVRPGSVSFYSWNLFRRYGDNWYEKWKDMMAKRMAGWGLNTVGNWSDPTLGPTRHIPYVATLGGWGTDADYMGMPDVYAAGFIEHIDSAASRQCTPLKNDPFLLGYFIGNEPPWPGREQELARVIIEGKDTPMRKALMEYLASEDSPVRRKEFVYASYVRFISIINKAIRKYDPNHLNLGMRYGGSPPDDIIKASKDYFDVFSVNIYGYTPKPDLLQKITNLTGLPIIIGEFHFGTPGRGLAPGLAQTSSYEERGIAYRYYVENAAANPAVIGTHWFQWTDQPSTGRFDGENYNIGFVDVTDQPYPDLVRASKEIFPRLLDIHSGKEAPFSRLPVKQ